MWRKVSLKFLPPVKSYNKENNCGTVMLTTGVPLVKKPFNMMHCLLWGLRYVHVLGGTFTIRVSSCGQKLFPISPMTRWIPSGVDSRYSLWVCTLITEPNLFILSTLNELNTMYFAAWFICICTWSLLRI